MTARKGESREEYLARKRVYLVEYYTRPEVKTKRRVNAARRYARPEIKARQQVYAAQYEARPETKAKRLERSRKPEAKARKKAYSAQYTARPEVKAWIKEREHKPEVKALRQAYRHRPERQAKQFLYARPDCTSTLEEITAIYRASINAATGKQGIVGSTRFALMLDHIHDGPAVGLIPAWLNRVLSENTLYCWENELRPMLSPECWSYLEHKMRQMGRTE